MSYLVIVGETHAGPMSKDDAEELAESVWQRRGVHTKVIDEHGNVVCEFEV